MEVACRSMQSVEPGSFSISCAAGEATKSERQSSRTSHKIAQKIEAKTCPDRRKNDEISTKNRRKVALGQLGATKVDSGASREASGTASEREKIVSGSFLGARGRLQDRPGGIRRASGGLLGRSCGDFGCYRDASLALCVVETPLGSIFRRFRLIARKLRCASRTTFYNVLLLLDAESTERVGRAPKLEKAWFSASKIDPGSVLATQNRAPGCPARARKRDSQAKKF